MKVDKQRFLSSNPRAKVVILTADKFEDLELLVPYSRLLEVGVHVDVRAAPLSSASPAKTAIGSRTWTRRSPT